MTKIKPCRGCGEPVNLPDRARPSEYYCTDLCRPICDETGCTTLAKTNSSKCWHHRAAANERP